MSYLSKITGITRSPGDPQVISTGPSSLGTADQLARALGWFSIGLGAFELFAPRAITRALGAEGNEGLVRLYGAREIGSGILTLSLEKDAGLWGRVAGDGLDILTVAQRPSPQQPQARQCGPCAADATRRHRARHRGGAGDDDPPFPLARSNGGTTTTAAAFPKVSLRRAR